LSTEIEAIEFPFSWMSSPRVCVTIFIRTLESSP
jgi:hypothetical protein